MEAVRVAELPPQTVPEFTVKVGLGFTFIIANVVSLQFPVVPMIVYVVVTVGLAVTVDPVVALNPLAGVQIYVVPPVAVRDTEPPPHIVCGAFANTSIGVELFTVTVTGTLYGTPQLLCRPTVHV